MKNICIFIILTLFISSCSGGYKQEYADFESFNKTNLRNKSWFPKIIDSSAYKLKSVSYLDELADFGTFSYTAAENYDRIFKDLKKKIGFSEFELTADQHKNQIPRWFLNIKNIDTNNFETIKVDGFYLTRNKQEKQVYFILIN